MKRLFLTKNLADVRYELYKKYKVVKLYTDQGGIFAKICTNFPREIAYIKN